jgi:hypothetical protein
MSDDTNTPPRRSKRGGPGSGKPPPPLVVGPGNFEQTFPPPARKRGAPTEFTPELADAICSWLEEGRSLKSFCEQPGTPAKGTVLEWRKTKPEFEARVVASREFGIEQLAETALDDAASRPGAGRKVTARCAEMVLLETPSPVCRQGCRQSRCAGERRRRPSA